MPNTPQLISLETQWAAKNLRMQRLAAKFISNSLSLTTFDFTIGDGNPGTPADTDDTYINPLITPDRTVTVYLYDIGYLTYTTDWIFADGGGVTLVGETYETGERYLIFIH